MFPFGQIICFYYLIKHSATADLTEEDIQVSRRLPTPLDAMWYVRNDTLGKQIKKSFEVGSMNMKPEDVSDILRQYPRPLSYSKNLWDMMRRRLMYTMSANHQKSNTEMRKLQKIRSSFINIMEYEVGFLTHEITYRYRVMVELIDALYYVNTSPNPSGREAKKTHNAQAKGKTDAMGETSRFQYWPPFTYPFLYENVITLSTEINLLCDMMHELPPKYSKQKGQMGMENFVNDGDRETERKLAKEFAKKLQMKKNKKNQKYFKDRGPATTKKTKRKKSWQWPLQYGWSIEETSW